MLENLCYFMLGPSALTPLSHHQRRRINYAIL
jgi:hypothetical protein